VHTAEQEHAIGVERLEALERELLVVQKPIPIDVE
jgi:hypothetical protein